MKVPILIPNIFDHPFTYESNSLNLDKGNYVTVPFGATKITGIVWNSFEKTEKKFQIKKIEKKLNVPQMKGSMIDFLNWFSIYNVVPIGMCIRLTLLSKGVVENIPDSSFNQYQILNKNSKYTLNLEQAKCLSEIKKKENIMLVTKQAPEFKATAVMPDNSFKDISLSDYKGKKVVLFFYPLDFTFV